VIREAIKTLPVERKCKCGSALNHAIITDPKVVPAKTKKNLAAILGKYLP
jgi:5'-methylthioadenosine phosphorylase